LTANYPNLSYTTLVDGTDAYAASPVDLLQDDLTAVVADAQLGWLKSKVVWTYATASTFTCPGDYTLVFTKGTKLMWTQTTVKYGYVTAVSYSSPNTTVTIAVTPDYTIANAAITLPYYSYAENPQGFPDWFTYTAVTVGFTSNPPTNVSKFNIKGHTVTMVYWQSAVGASSLTTFTVSLPITAATVANFGWTGALGRTYDNSAEAAAGQWEIVSAATVCTLYKSTHAAWTNSNNKQAQFIAQYEMA